MTSAAESLITATVNGTPLGVFDTRSGGETSAETSARRSGGMGPMRPRRARATHGDVTITRAMLDGDPALVKRLRPLVGFAEGSVNEQPLDMYGAVGSDKPTTYSGILKSLSTGDSDAESDDDAVLELVFTVTAVS